MEEVLDRLCDSVAQLCEFPFNDPGALYGLKKQVSAECFATVSGLYARVVKNVEPCLNDKGIYPESSLIKGFDKEQHFQQVALVSREAAGVFVPKIAFSETQLENIQFPVYVEGERKYEDKKEETDKTAEDDVSLDGDESGSEFQVGEGKSGESVDSVVSDSELDEEEDFSDEDFDLEVDEKNVPSEEESLPEGTSWHEVEPRESSDNHKNTPMSSFEKSRRKLSEEIHKMEEKQLEDKPWQLKGETEASARPINSLLEEVLEYDMTQRPAPVITEEVTYRLEDVILKRIKDKAFDDVERKIKPVAAPLELKKKIVLDQEKSKLSLAEVYEQEYLKQRAQAKSEGAMPTSVVPENELTDEEKTINAGLGKLFFQLDCLSNFHYTPPPRTAEVEIVANLPAVNVEEVGQDALTTASLLTPGEVSGKFRNTVKGSTEKTKTDKKRERRKKKIHQAKKFNKLQLTTAVKSAQPTPGKGKIKLADPALKSSTHFFSQLENQVKKHIDSNKRQAEEDKKNKFKAKKLKL